MRYIVEVTNTIRRRVARGLIRHADGLQRIATFEQLAIRTITPPGLHREALDLAETLSRPAVYDAYYLALAQMVGCDFWTADQALLNAEGGALRYVKWIRRYPY